MRVGLFCELTVRPEYMDTFLPLMEKHSTSCPQVEEGCLLFRVGRDRDDPNMIRIYEEYLNQGPQGTACLHRPVSRFQRQDRPHAGERRRLRG